MATSTENPSQVLEAIEGFVTDLDGTRYIVNRETTRIAASHPLAKAYPQHFRPIEEGLSFRTEEATDEPGGPPRERPVVTAPEPPTETPASGQASSAKAKR